MKRDSAIEVIMSRLGNRKGLEEKAVLEMQLAQERLETGPEMPWFLETKDTSVTAASTSDLALPTLYQRTHDDGIWIKDVSDLYQPVCKIDLPALLRFRAGNTSEGLPDRYALWGTLIELYPTPNAVYSIDHYHWAKGALLDTNVENAWLQYSADLLISETGIVMAQCLRDDKAVQLFASERQDAQKRLTIDSVAREEAGRVQRMGG